MAEVEREILIKNYIDALENYANDQVSLPASRFQDLEGNYIFQERQSNQWILIQPPIYQMTPDIKRELRDEAVLLNTELQFDRNNIALTLPNDKEKLEREVKKYNDSCEQLGKIDIKLKGVSKFSSPELIDLKEKVKSLEGEQEELLHATKIGGTIEKTGKLPELGSRIEILHDEIINLIPLVFPGNEPKIYEITDQMIPKTPEGNKLREKTTEWDSLNKEYKELNDVYLAREAEIEELNKEILDIQLSRYKLGLGTAPKVETITADEANRRKSCIVTKSQEPPIGILAGPEGLPEKKGIIRIKKKELLTKQATIPRKPSEVKAVAQQAPIAQAEAPNLQKKTIIRRIYKKDVSKCAKGPAAGGYAMKELKALAEEAGISTKGKKKAEICLEIEKAMK